MNLTEDIILFYIKKIYKAAELSPYKIFFQKRYKTIFFYITSLQLL